MSKKFNAKQYQGKPRVYTQVAGTQGVQRVWVWDLTTSQYKPPARGKAYEARRRVGGSRQKQSFDTLEEARRWQSSQAEPHTATQGSVAIKLDGMLFASLIEEWRKRTFPSIAVSTQVAYDKIVRLHLGSLTGLTIYELTPARIDQWIDGLKDPEGLAMQSKTRKRFDHELGVLTSILRYYESYHDDVQFKFPVKQRHREAVLLNRPSLPKSKDLSEEEFFKFRERLATRKHGAMLAAMATVQYYQALRVSEVAALHWEDVTLNEAEPKTSRLKVMRKVYWPRLKGVPSYIQAGFKNSAASGGVKEQPLFVPAYQALASIHSAQANGLVFQVAGSHFEYRQVQHAYDRAFKAAGLPYSATHVMRHGGCRRVFNATGDLSIAGQHLGNTSHQATAVYAKRSVSALTNVAHGEWDKYEAGRIGSQTQSVS